jgi:hypothetical protein
MSRVRPFLLIFVLALPLAAQQTPQPANPGTPPVQVAPPANPNDRPKTKIEITVPLDEPQKPGAKSQPQPEHRMTQAQADELFKSVDEILAWVSKDTGLPIKHPVKRKLATRAEVEKYVKERMTEDEDARRLERSVLVLKKFGLVPRDFDLGTFMVKLLGEQVVGYYDPKTKYVNLLDWVTPEEQKPVLAHELTHALQDQNYDLDKWMRAGQPEHLMDDTSVPKDPVEEQKKLQKQVDEDERQAARQAVSEGQGMAVLIDYTLAPLGKSVADAPEIVEVMKNSMASGADSPVFSSAPVFLREVLTFPYKYGLGFEGALLTKGGKRAAYGNALEHPPETSRDIMEPQRYLAGQEVPSLRVPPIGNIIGRDWEKLDVGAMGEFDVFLLLEQYANADTAKRLAPSWRGGYYYAALKKSAGKSNRELKTSELSVFYVSRWESVDAAREFADVYSRSFLTRYRDISPKKKAEGRDVLWGSNEGALYVEPVGEYVIVSESFDAALAAKLRDAALPQGAAATASGKEVETQ